MAGAPHDPRWPLATAVASSGWRPAKRQEAGRRRRPRRSRRSSRPESQAPKPSRASSYLGKARSTDVYLLQASGNAEGEAAADVSRPSCFARQVERSLLVRADGRTTDTEASHPRRALLAVGHLAPQRCRARCSGQSSIGLPVLASLVCDGMIPATLRKIVPRKDPIDVDLHPGGP